MKFAMQLKLEIVIHRCIFKVVFFCSPFPSNVQKIQNAVIFSEIRV